MITYHKSAVLFAGLRNSWRRGFHTHVFNSGINQRLRTLGLLVDIIPGIRRGYLYLCICICVFRAKRVGIDSRAHGKLIIRSGISELCILILRKKLAGITGQEHALVAADLISDKAIHLVTPLCKNDIRILFGNFRKIGRISGGCADNQVTSLVYQLLRCFLYGCLICVVDTLQCNQVVLRDAQIVHGAQNAVVCRLAPSAVVYHIRFDLTDFE